MHPPSALVFLTAAISPVLAGTTGPDYQAATFCSYVNNQEQCNALGTWYNEPYMNIDYPDVTVVKMERGSRCTFYSDYEGKGEPEEMACNMVQCQMALSFTIKSFKCLSTDPEHTESS